MVVPGLGSGRWDWADVLDRLPGRPPVLFVEPTGRLGRDEDWQPPAVAARLRAWLRDRLITDDLPVLLVGHSAGALSVQAFAYTYPRRCVAALLVDGSHARRPRPAWSWLRAAGRIAGAGAAGPATLVAPALRCAAVRGLSVRRRDPLTTGERRCRYRSRAWTLAVLDGWFGHALLQAALIRRQSLGPPAVPVRVVAGVSRVRRRGLDLRWASLQRELAARLGAPDPVLLPDAAHLVTLDRPDAVAAAIRRLVAPGGLDYLPDGRDRAGDDDQIDEEGGGGP